MSIYEEKQLIADSEEHFLSLCSQAGLVDENGEVIVASHNHSLMIKGITYSLSGGFADDGMGGLIEGLSQDPGYRATLKVINYEGMEALDQIAAL